MIRGKDVIAETMTRAKVVKAGTVIRAKVVIVVIATAVDTIKGRAAVVLRTAATTAARSLLRVTATLRIVVVTTRTVKAVAEALLMVLRRGRMVLPLTHPQSSRDHTDDETAVVSDGAYIAKRRTSSECLRLSPDAW